MATCSVCSHPQRLEIEQAMLNGVPYRRSAQTHGLSIAAISRHKRHLAPGLLAASKDVIAKKDAELARACTRLVASISSLSRKADLVAAKYLAGHRTEKSQGSFAG
jgi:hypothetical protein